MTPLVHLLHKKLRSNLERMVDGRGQAVLSVRFYHDGRQEDVDVSVPHSLSQTKIPPIFLTYSMTKSFIAVLILQLIQENRLTLATPISRWMPSIMKSSTITIYHLLTHTAGLPDYGPLSAYQNAVRATPSQPWDFATFAAHTYDLGLSFEPGQGWAYSNPGYMLLKRIVEIECDESLASVLATRICHVLGLRHTFVAESMAHLCELVPAYSSSVETTGMPTDVRAVYHPGWVAHGVIASTAQDIVTFYDQLFSGGLLSPDVVEQITTLVPVPHAPAPYERAGYGLGIMGGETSRYGPLWGHNGSGPGYRVSAFHAPEVSQVPITVCAMCAVEVEGLAERLVFDALEYLKDAI